LTTATRPQPPETVAVAVGNKFAVIAVPESEAGYAPAPVINLDNGFYVSHALPAAALDTWTESLGSIHIRELARTGLFLWSLRESATPEVVDGENEPLERDAYRLYMGLLIAISNFGSGRLTAVTGGNGTGVARARTLTTYPGTYRTAGSSSPPLTISRLRRAASLALALRQHTNASDNRAVRAIRAFRQAAEAKEIDTRLHQFVRCIEGFTNPRDAKQFSGRIARVCAGPCRSPIRELYSIRSKVEHLHGPYAGMQKRPRGGRWLRLVQRSIQVEAVSRYMLQSYLLRPALWPTFETASTLNAFWALPVRQLRSRWGPRLDFPAILRGFNVHEFEIASAGP
jgi:hypothetical protein